jgi:serine/threonine protein kinase
MSSQRLPMFTLFFGLAVVSAKPADASAGSLLLTVDPPGARVHLDGGALSPADERGVRRLDGVVPGVHLLELWASGRYPYAQVFAQEEAVAARTVRLEPVRGAEIDPTRGRLVVAVDVSDIVVVVDGALAGFTDRKGLRVIEGLSPGRHTVHLAWKDWVFVSMDAIVEGGRETRVEAQAPPDALQLQLTPGIVFGLLGGLATILVMCVAFIRIRRRRQRRRPAAEQAGSGGGEGSPTLRVPFGLGDLDALCGRTIGERIRLDAIRTQDATGALFDGRVIADEQAVSVVVLRPGMSDDPYVAQRVLQQLELASHIDHAGHVRIRDFDKSIEGVLYAVLDPVIGPSLADELRAGEPLSRRRAIPLLAQVAEVLEAAHARGVIHRDLRPSRILLSADSVAGERARVWGFGIAQAWQIEGRLVGEDDEMLIAQSPEQLRGLSGEAVDARADVFAMGVLAFRLLLGRAPFSVTSRDRLLELYASEALPPCHDLRAPAAARAAILDALWIDPERRTSSPRALAEAIAVAYDEDL